MRVWLSRRRTCGGPCLFPLLRRRFLALGIEWLYVQHRAATSCGAAAAGVELQFLGIVRAFPCQLIIVAQLFAGFDRARRLDEDAPVVDDGLAVRITFVIDEPRRIAAHAGVDADLVVHDKQESVTVVERLFFVPRICDGV